MPNGTINSADWLLRLLFPETSASQLTQEPETVVPLRSLIESVTPQPQIAQPVAAPTAQPSRPGILRQIFTEPPPVFVPPQAKTAMTPEEVAAVSTPGPEEPVYKLLSRLGLLASIFAPGPGILASAIFSGLGKSALRRREEMIGQATESGTERERLATQLAMREVSAREPRAPAELEVDICAATGKMCPEGVSQKGAALVVESKLKRQLRLAIAQKNATGTTLATEAGAVFKKKRLGEPLTAGDKQVLRSYFEAQSAGAIGLDPDFLDTLLGESVKTGEETIGKAPGIREKPKPAWRYVPGEGIRRVK